MCAYMRKHKLLALLLIVTTMLSIFSVPSLATEEGYIDSINDEDWVKVYEKNILNDPLGDKQTGGNSVSQDIVGDANYSSVFYCFTDERLSFRIRVNDIDGGTSDSDYQFKNFAYIGMDTDLDGCINLFLGAYTPHSTTGRIAIYGVDSSANSSPATTIITKPILANQPKRGDNFSIKKATDGSQFTGTDDYFISFSISVDDINKALGESSTFDKDTMFRFIVGTASQDNSLNQDINGVDGGITSDLPWSSLGAFSDVASAAKGLEQTDKITVTFDENTGDNIPDPQIIVVDKDTGIGKIPSELTKRGGYYFQGFNTERDGSGNKVSASSTFSENTTVYAQWSKNSVVAVTFNPKGGNFSGSTDSITVNTVDGIVGELVPQSPTNTTHNATLFLGWYTNPEDEATLFDPFSTVTENTTVYAKWGQDNNPHRAEFRTNDGSIVYMTVIWNGNQTLKMINLPERAKQTFLGWSETQNGSTASYSLGSSIERLNKNITLYAVWKNKDLTNINVTFDKNTDKGVSDMPESRNPNSDGLFGDLPTEPVCLDSNYKFVEWNTQADGKGEKIFAETEVLNDITVYAIWKEVKTVTFRANIPDDSLDDNAKNLATQLIELNEVADNSSTEYYLKYYPTAPILKDCVKKTFIGWMTTATGTTSDVEVYSAKAPNTTYYGLWDDVYTVTFYTNGGQFSDATIKLDVETAYGSVLYTPETPTYKDAVFAGWNTEPDGTGDDFDVTDLVNSNIIVYAQWVPTNPSANVVVTFDSDGGDLVPSQIIKKDTAATEPDPVPTKNGYDFLGWYDGEAEWEFSTPISETKNLKARWKVKENNYTVNWDVNGGNALTDASTSYTNGSVEEGTTIVKPTTAPTKTQDAQYTYAFDGWYTNATGGSKVEFGSITVSENVTYYAHYTPTLRSYTITWKSDDGSQLKTEQVNYGATPSYGDNNPTKDATAQYTYTFTGWSPTVVAVTGEATYTAQYSSSAKSYTLTWNLDGGDFPTDIEDYTSGSVKYGTSITQPSKNPTKFGYTFNEWSPSVPSTMPAADTTITALWTANTVYYTITWRDENGNVIKKETLPNGSTITLPDNPAKKGYTFKGWSPNVPDTIQGENLVFTATWKKNVDIGKIIGIGIGAGIIIHAGHELIENILKNDEKINDISVGTKPTTPYDTNITEPEPPEEPADYEPTLPSTPEDNGVSDELIIDEHNAYLKGYTDGEIKLNTKITRAEAAMIFYRLLKDNTCEKPVSFTDVEEGMWYEAAIETLAGRGIICGYPDGSFNPDKAITRAEFTAIAIRFANTKSGNSEFTDVPKDYWAYDEIAAATDYGWITGYPDGTYKPDNTISRAEVATIVNRMLGRSADEVYVDKNYYNIVNFYDLRDNKEWYFYQIVEATNNHTFTMNEGGETWRTAEDTIM